MKTLIYENAACFRCSGTGYYGPVCVAGGKCLAKSSLDLVLS